MIVKSELLQKADILNNYAAKLMPLPDKLTPPEQNFYLSLRIVYREYRANQISIEQAKSEKHKLINALLTSAYKYDLYEWGAKHETAFQHLSHEIYTNGCPVCKKLKRTLQGLENIEEEKQ